MSFPLANVPSLKSVEIVSRRKPQPIAASATSKSNDPQPCPTSKRALFDARRDQSRIDGYSQCNRRFAKMVDLPAVTKLICNPQSSGRRNPYKIGNPVSIATFRPAFNNARGSATGRMMAGDRNRPNAVRFLSTASTHASISTQDLKSIPLQSTHPPSTD